MLSIHSRRLCQRVCGNTQPHRSVCRLRPVLPSRPASARWRLLSCLPCVSVWDWEGVNSSHPNWVSVERGPECLFPCLNRRNSWNRTRTLASYARLCRRPVDPRRAGGAPGVAPGVLFRRSSRCYRGFVVSTAVWTCVLLSFLRGSPRSVCLPSLSAGRARNLRHRNFRSRC